MCVISKSHIVIFAFLIFPCCGYGQTCCTGGAPLVGSLHVTDLDSGAFGLTLSYDFNKIEDFYQGNRKLNEDFIKRSTKTLFLQLDYSFDGNATVALMLPYVWLSERIDQQNVNSSNANPGDIIVMGQYKIVKRIHTGLTAGIGVKLPTGETQSRDAESQFILVPTLQAGTGSLDYIFLVQGTQRMSFRKTLEISQSFYYKLNGNSSKFASHDNYRFGHEFQSITSFSDQLLIGPLINYPAILIKIRSTSKDKINTHFNENTGGTWLYISPKWTVQLSPNWSVSLLADFPIIRRLNGFQITTTRRARISLNIKL